MAATYTLIASNTLNSSAASVTFSAIPNTFTDLVVRVSARSNDTYGGTAFSDNFYITLNSLTSNYSQTILNGNGAAASSSRASSQARFSYTNMVSGGNTSNTFSSVEIYIPSYTSSHGKPISTFAADENNTTTAYIKSIAYLQTATAAISSITMNPNFGSFVSGSSFFLYGIKNS